MRVFQRLIPAAIALLTLAGSAFAQPGPSPAPAGTTGANPTACVASTATNGTATTFTRSDGAPAICSSVNLPGSPTTTTQTPLTSNTTVSTTAYTDAAVATAVAGINPAVAVQAATTTAGNTSGLTYNNGAGGVGATFTGTTNTALTVDGYTFTALGQRLLVKNDTQSPSGAFNGVYYVTQIQTSLLPPILTRALDYDQPSDINNTGAIPVVNGTVNGLTSWLLTSSVATVGTSPLTYAQFTYGASSGGPVLLATLTASNSASLVDTTHITSAYKSYEFRFFNLAPTSASTLRMWVSTNGGSSYLTSNYAGLDVAYAVVNASAASAGFVDGLLGEGQQVVGNIDAGTGLTGTVRLYQPAAVAQHAFDYQLSYLMSAAPIGVSGSGQYTGSTTAINAVQIIAGTGTLASGFVEIWGWP